jgi:hypothetical protein
MYNKGASAPLLFPAIKGVSLAEGYNIKDITVKNITIHIFYL